MNVETGTEAPQFPGKEYLNGIFLVVKVLLNCKTQTEILNGNMRHVSWIVLFSQLINLVKG